VTSRVSWTPEAVRALGVRTTVPIAGEILGGLTRTQSYELHKAGKFPVPVVAVGRRLICPVAPILTLLGMDSDAGDDPVRPDLTVVRDRANRPGNAA
jgi:hypothetical protein